MAIDEEWVAAYTNRLNTMTPKAKEIRERAKNDLYFFARLVNPGYMYGEIHEEVYRWLQDYTLYGNNMVGSNNKLIMLPRAHLKSHMVATTCAWMIMRHPEITILYVSATSSLAELQLYAIKNILTSVEFTRYFPEYVNPQEAKRAQWSTTSITIDHLKRAKEGVRDKTIETAGLTTNTTGKHADMLVSDDLVVPGNAYTEEGRESVKKAVSQFTSILNAGGYTLACGTRYHPNDIYAEWKNQKFEVYGDDGTIEDVIPVWDIKEYAVEVDDNFLWKRVVRPEDGKHFGFDRQVLARIKAQYLDREQFFAQYYNDPNPDDLQAIDPECFQYYEQRHLKEEDGKWYMNGDRLNVYAAIDFAYTKNRKSDSSVIVVIGINYDDQVFILDIDSFKTDKLADYFSHLKRVHSKWNVKMLRAECTAAQSVIVRDIKESFKKEGIPIAIEEYKPTVKEGSKEERISAALDWRYAQRLMFHFKGGYTEVLEDELVKSNPAHDDHKDALAAAVSVAVKPTFKTKRKQYDIYGNEVATKGYKFNKRFGGIAFK